MSDEGLLFAIAFNAVAGLLQIGFSLVIMYIFFSCFFPRRNPNTLKKWLPYAAFFCWTTIISFVQTPMFINVIMLVGLFYFYVIVWFEGRIFQKIACSGIFLTMWAFSEVAIAYLFTLLGKDYKLYPYLGAYLSQFLLFIVVLYFYKFFGVYRIKNLPAKYYITLSLLPLSSIFIIVKILMYSIELENERAMQETAICLFIMIAINVLIFKLHISLADEMATAKYNAIYAQQLELYGKTVREREMSMAEYRSIRHDMKQHYSSVLNMLEKQNYQAAEEYLKQLVEDNTDHSQICRTENPVIDAIVNAKYSGMKMQGIECSTDIHIPMQLPFDMADMSVLLGNVLDNAIEANNDNVVEKYIKIYMAYDKNILIITVINSYDGTLLRDKTGNILTRKSDPNSHGFGLVSVQRIVQKYHGSMVIEDTSAEFKIKLILIDDENHMADTSAIDFYPPPHHHET